MKNDIMKTHDLAVSFSDPESETVWPADNLPDDENDDEITDDDDTTFRILGKSTWILSSFVSCSSSSAPAVIGHPSSSFVPHKPISKRRKRKLLGMPGLVVRKNLPFGFADIAFPTKVRGRVPYQNHKGLPLPEDVLLSYRLSSPSNTVL